MGSFPDWGQSTISRDCPVGTTRPACYPNGPSRGAAGAICLTVRRFFDYRERYGLPPSTNIFRIMGGPATVLADAAGGDLSGVRCSRARGLQKRALSRLGLKVFVSLDKLREESDLCRLRPGAFQADTHRCRPDWPRTECPPRVGFLGRATELPRLEAALEFGRSPRRGAGFYWVVGASWFVSSTLRMVA